MYKNYFKMNNLSNLALKETTQESIDQITIKIDNIFKSILSKQLSNVDKENLLQQKYELLLIKDNILNIDQLHNNDNDIKSILLNYINDVQRIKYNVDFLSNKPYTNGRF